MLYLKLFEEFTKDEVVTLNGRKGIVVSEKGDDVVVKFFKPNTTKIVHKDDIKSKVKCLSQCDKGIVGDGDNRFVKCSFCGKEQKFKKKHLKKKYQ